MDYPLESLGAERFQRVCQALLAREFPSARITPLTGRDGGRDAFLRRRKANRSGLVVFQVKFAKSPASIADPRKWVLDAVQLELPKIEALLPRGLEHYRLITNVGGSGHLDVGSVDKLDQLLEKLPVPADGWWRDDLAARLDDAWDIKWAFPELFTGPDLLRAIIETGLGESNARRSSAISAFLADQYEEDSRVKFKQVELENRLLDLYVDVELQARPSDTARGRAAQSFVFAVARREGEPVNHQPRAVSSANPHTYAIWAQRSPSAGAASALLADEDYGRRSWLVLEGAPGQGKSTVTQYVCQVHRMRLLGRSADLAGLPDAHKSGPLRLPFRVDLRDLAGWLHGRNPFGDALDSSSANKRTLETFFSTQIELASGGAEFSVADLHAVARVSSLAFVFDGLDEVADIDERRRVVREVTSGLRRLSQISASLQAIITSRPAAFENSPGFARDTFDYYELVDLDMPIVESYATRWIKARGLRPREASDVRSVLKTKLAQPHMRELARNPMQLAILLSLINRRGPSLPDKRTALYDSYVNTFFDREAEKTEDVQRHRDVLMELHQYLAWRLQAEAEKGLSQGSISEGDLRMLLAQYLVKEEKDASLVDVLFKSLVERVVAIVSRVQGTYEFEVQPLREYFAARYLYDTAHYSPTGAEHAGDKTDRFDALARNFYWLNVTRFFAGCFSKGELPSLTDRLEVLANDDRMGLTDQPRLLAVMLLSDWVFAQHPKSVKAVVDLILDGFGVRGGETATGAIVTLPEGSGRAELAEQCWRLAEMRLGADRAFLVMATAKMNSEPDACDARWLRTIRKMNDDDRAKWLRYGLWTGSLSRMPDATVEELISPPSDISQLLIALEGGHGKLIDAKPEWAEPLIDALLDGVAVPNPYGSEPLTGVVDAMRRVLACVPGQWEPHTDWWEKDYEDARAEAAASDCIERCWEVLDVAREHFRGVDQLRWVSSIAPWNTLVESLRAHWGERWVPAELAITAAGIRSAKDRGSAGAGIFDRTGALCERARYARLRAGAGKWWARRLAEAPTQFDEKFVTALFFSWASPKTLSAQLPAFDAWLAGASESAQRHVISAASRAGLNNSAPLNSDTLNVAGLASLDPMTVIALFPRANRSARLALADRYLADYTGDEPLVLRAAAQAAVDAAEADADRWPAAIRALQRAHVVGAAAGLPRLLTDAETGPPYDSARTVVKDAEQYPLALVHVAERVCRREVGGAADAVADIALSQKW